MSDITDEMLAYQLGRLKQRLSDYPEFASNEEEDSIEILVKRMIHNE